MRGILLLFALLVDRYSHTTAQATDLAARVMSINTRSPVGEIRALGHNFSIPVQSEMGAETARLWLLAVRLPWVACSPQRLQGQK